LRRVTPHPATGDPVKRVIQPVGIAFKGSGFYVTDSRGKNGASKSAGKPDQGKTGSPKGEAPPPPPAATSTQAAASGTD